MNRVGLEPTRTRLRTVALDLFALRSVVLAAGLEPASGDLKGRPLDSLHSRVLLVDRMGNAPNSYCLQGRRPAFWLSP